MAYAEQAYRLDAYPDFAPGQSGQPEQRGRRMRVVRTGGESEEGPASLLVTAAWMAAIILVVVAALSFARIALTSATVATLIEGDSFSSKIEEARSWGVGLEMEQSVLANTYAIDAAAERLNMTEPLQVGSIALAPDVVVTDADGALSLSGSVSSLVENQA